MGSYNAQFFQVNIIKLTIVTQIRMSLSSIQVQDLYQKSQVHDFAYQTQKNNFNIRRFADNKSRNKKQILRTKYTEYTRNRLSTEPVEDRVKKMDSIMSMTNAFDKFMNKNEPDHNKRNTMTGSLKHRDNRSLSLTKSDINKMQENTTNIESEKAKKCKQIDKKFNKGPLKKRVIEAWLNSILMQSTQFEVIDESLGNAALKKFEIDENSLLSRGVKPENIQRIYQSLFVHSIGFNNNIKQLVSSHCQVMKNVWKVFSILLEYCAQGKFETLIGVIERDKAIKLEQLREQIAKRQEIIERNDQLNENKNIQIFKEIKHLKDENINLKNEKDILYEDYQKTQQAFNEEIALRLKFENKINELFGVHRQLVIKHQRLYEQYKKKMIELNATNQKNSQLTQQNGEIKIQINDLLMERQRLLSSQKYTKQLMNAIKEEKMKINDEYNLIKHQYDDERRINKENKRRVSQLEIEVKNLTEIVGLKDKSWLETHQQYQLSLEENKRLYSIINEQRKQVEQLLFEKKQFNNRVLNLMADASFERKKKEEFMRFYYDADKKAKDTSDKIKNLELENKILNKRNESIEEDLKINYKNIQKMHQKNDELQDQLLTLRKFRDSLDSVIGQKNIENQAFRTKNESLIKQNEQLKGLLGKSEMNLKIMKAQFESQAQSLRSKYEKIKEQRQMLQLGQNQRNQSLILAKIEAEKLSKLLQNTILDLKNEKFERVHLKANYDQSLTIIQKKNAEQKQMGRQISQLKDSVLKTSQQRNRLQLALQIQTRKRQRFQQLLLEIKQQYEQYRLQKFAYIHPFVYEDLAEAYRILKDKLSEAYLIIQMRIEQIKETNQKYTNKINSINKSYEEYFSNYKKQKEKQLEQKDSELQYEKQMNVAMKARLEHLEELADTYAKKIQERTASQKEKMYADLVEQKTKAMEDLVKRLNLYNQKNEELQRQILKITKQNEQTLFSLKQEMKSEIQTRDEKINDLNFEKKYYQSELHKLKEEVKEHEARFEQKLKENMEMYMQNYKHVEENVQHANSVTQEQRESVDKFRDTKIKWSMLEDIEKKNPGIKKRNDISRKLKISYTYYQHKESK